MPICLIPMFSGVKEQSMMGQIDSRRCHFLDQLHTSITQTNGHAFDLLFFICVLLAFCWESLLVIIASIAFDQLFYYLLRFIYLLVVVKLHAMVSFTYVFVIYRKKFTQLQNLDNFNQLTIHIVLLGSTAVKFLACM